MSNSRRSRKLLTASVVYLFLLTTPAFSSFAGGVAVVGAVISIVKFFNPNESGSDIVSILVAMNQNISQINEGMQAALQELDELRIGQQKLPQSVYDYKAVRQIAGQLQALSEVIESKAYSGPEFNEIAYYRDLFNIYDDVRKVRQEAINSSYSISENLVLHIPLLFTLEGAAYTRLTGTITGNSQDESLSQYGVNLGSWLVALENYLRFYETAIDTKIKDSFAAERIELERQINTELAKYDKGSLGTYSNAKEGDEFSTCYYEVTKSVPYGYSEYDDRGSRFFREGDMVTYKLSHILYYVDRRGFREAHLKNTNPISEIFKDVYEIGEYTLAVEDGGFVRGPKRERIWVIDELFDIADYETSSRYCSEIIPKSEIPSKDPFISMDYQKLSKDIHRLNFLASINDLNKQAAPKLYALARVYKDRINLKAYPLVQALVPENER